MDRLLPFVNYAVCAYVWGLYITDVYTTPDGWAWYEAISGFLLSTLLSSYATQVLQYAETNKQVLVHACAFVIQCWIYVRTVSILNSITICTFYTKALMGSLILVLDIASFFPRVAEMLSLGSLYLCDALYFYKSAIPTLFSYAGPLLLLGHMVVISFGIATIPKFAKRKIETLPIVLGLNDSQLIYVLFTLFAFALNFIDCFEGWMHIVPLLAAPFVLPAFYTQLDSRTTIAKILSLSFFLLYSALYHTVKHIAYHPTL